jgi:hypothetical protein
MTAYARTRKIMVGAEPRGDDFALLTEVIRGGGAYTNPDVGNFGGDQAHQHAGIRAMFPYTDGNCHMKMHNPPTYDLAAATALIKSLGYTGLYSIENEQQAIRTTTSRRCMTLSLRTSSGRRHASRHTQ